jgi:CheY-like chemotaxis protein
MTGIFQTKRLMSILIVDDDAFNNFAMEQLIRTIGKFEIHLAINGKDAIDCVVKRSGAEPSSFDLIIMDLNMPVMDGMASTKKLRKMHKQDKINLDSTKIYMHSAIQESIDWYPLFDGKCKTNIHFC